MNSATFSALELDPSSETLVGQAFESPDYRDAYRVSTEPGRFENINEAVRGFFLAQPWWFSLLSLNVVSRDRAFRELDACSFDVGSSLGSWKVHARGDDEIVFGDHMGFMDYRFALRLLPNEGPDCDLLEGSTSVRYRWRRAGRFYFALVRPMHRRFVAMALKNMALKNMALKNLALKSLTESR